MQTYIVFDLETNGIGSFRPPTQTITQIAFIKFNSDGEVLDQYSTVVKGATLVNSLIPAVKITMEQIRNEGVEPIVAYTRFLDAIDDDMIIYAHNADFDVNLLKRALQEFTMTFPNNKIICTMKNSSDYCKIPKTGYAARYGGFKWPSLSELAARLEIENDNHNFHDALYDCQITKECILKGKEVGLFE